MSRNVGPIFVYQRRGQHRKSLAITQSVVADPSEGCQSVIISSESPSMTAKEHKISFLECVKEVLKSPAGHMVETESNARAKPEFNECQDDDDDKASISGMDGVLDVYCVNDNCSSSKSNLEPNSVALKIYTDESGECSSSGALIAEKVPDELSERDIRILILKNQGLLDRARTGSTDASSHNYCSKPCKVCARWDSTSNMLICDTCTDAFHMSCCNPRIARIPVGEWLCSFCSGKKHKILCKSSPDGISTEIGSGNSASEGGLGSLEFMFRDTEPYMSNVRIGDEFQANVPDWSGPIYNECDEWWLEMDPSNNVSMQEESYIKPLKHSSIGNWLQCREFIQAVGDGDEGTICGKWRRAPLFEVQTDKWVCFSCVLWDPSHADCSVPQEVDTEEVKKQLKYIEILRPQLVAKRRKLVRSKSIGSQDLS
ncbi:hypothetical protein OROHE_006409 [Orobanche hederae]